jgi:dihydroorotate dehydrogenase electron transfer subunit
MKYAHDLDVIENKILSRNYFLLSLKCPITVPEIAPGQFAEIRIDHAPNTYLRRPFSVYDVNLAENTISFLIKKIGEGTNVLAALKPGDRVSIVYPLGKGFGEAAGTRVLLVGGGVGIAALLLLAGKMKKEGKEVDILFGGRSAEDIVDSGKFQACGELHVATEDGSMGEKGVVTQHPVMQDLSAFTKIYTCGPDPMMKAVAQIAHSQGISCEASLENLMACGIGACLCCVVETTGGNRTTCIDGPVFDTRLIKEWN